MIAHIAGVVQKSGSSQYGGWFTVAETIRKKDGGKFEKVTFCSGKDDPPAEGAFVAVQGYLRADVEEYNGKSYAKVKLQGAQWLALTGGAASEDAPATDDLADEDIPF